MEKIQVVALMPARMASSRPAGGQAGLGPGQAQPVVGGGEIAGDFNEQPEQQQQGGPSGGFRGRAAAEVGRQVGGIAGGQAIDGELGIGPQAGREHRTVMDRQVFDLEVTAALVHHAVRRAVGPWHSRP